MQKLVLCERGY